MWITEIFMISMYLPQFKDCVHSGVMDSVGVFSKISMILSPDLGEDLK